MKSIRSRMAKAMLAAVKDCISRNWNLNQLNKNGVSLVLILKPRSQALPTKEEKPWERDRRESLGMKLLILFTCFQ